MNKDAYFFSHDSNSKDDPKCVMLIEQLGLEGYGIFWILVETLRDQPDYKYPLSLLPAIARRYNTTTQKVEAVVKAYNLFKFTDDEFFFSTSLVNRMEVWEATRLKKSIAGKKGNQIRWDNYKAIAEQSHSDNIGIAPQSQNIAMKLNETKLNETNIYMSDSNEYRLAEYLKKHILGNIPTCRVPDDDNIQGWCKTMNLMLRVDKREVEDVKKHIELLKTDTFWGTKILSADKLRKQYDQLTGIINKNKVIPIKSKQVQADPICKTV